MLLPFRAEFGSLEDSDPIGASNTAATFTLSLAILPNQFLNVVEEH